MASRVDQFFSSLGLLIVSISLTLAVAELAVRVAMRPPAGADLGAQEQTAAAACASKMAPYDTPGECYFSVDSFARMNFSTFFGYVPAPNVSGRSYHTNGTTMRYDAELPIPKPAGEKRIFVTGGSTAWGAGVTQDQLFTAVAEKLVRWRNPGERVISAGVGGYVSLHEILRYMLYVRPLAPDAWAMFTGWNDIYAGYSGRGYVRSPDMMGLGRILFTRAGTDPIVSKWFVPTSASERPAPPLWGNYRSKLHWLLDKSLYQREVPTRLAPASGAESTAITPKQAAHMLVSNIVTAAEIARQDGIPFVAILQPSVYATAKPLAPFEADMVSAARAQYPGLAEYFAEGYGEARQLLAQASAEHGFPFYDADTAIAVEPRALFADHAHFGDRGNAKIGQFLAHALLGAE